MLKSVSIVDFGPDALISRTLEAPGSISIMTVPGLTPEPKPEPAARPVFVIAGSYQEFKAYLAKRKLREHSDARYLSSPERSQGLSDATIVLTGTYATSRAWPRFEAELLRYAKPCGLTVVEDPY